MKITMYTDGSSRGNPGPGGWGAILISEDEVIELGGREEMTTNNRMELSGPLHGLRELSGEVDGKKIEHIEVCTDSQYVKKGMTEWIDGWIKKGWKGSTKQSVLNQDLWQALKDEEDRLKSLGVQVSWRYVPGHAGVPLNERADEIATASALASNLQLYRGARKDYPVQF